MPFWSRKKRDDKSVPVGGSEGFGNVFGLHYTRHAQPDPGIAAVSYDALALPLYTPIGPSQQNARQFLSAPSNGVLSQNQAIGITTVGNPGYLTGSFRSTGLIDNQSSPGDIAAPAVTAPGSFELPHAP